MWRATYLWKALNEGYNFALDLTSIEGLRKKLWASKISEVLISRILKLPTWESKTKCHLDVAPVANHKEYYKGEGSGFPQIQTVVNLVNPCMLVVRSCTKSVTTTY
jgi:hypothetical protein